MDDDEPQCDCEEGAPAWMATFSDMATLLLTFFVLLLSFANMDVENFKVALGSVKEALGVQVEIDGDFEGFTTSPVQLNSEPSTAELSPERSRYKQLEAVSELVEAARLQSKIDVLDTARGIVLRIKDVVLFESGSADLKEAADPILQLVVELFGVFDGQLVVEGHTDDRPIHTERFPSNWELSAGRGTAVVRHLIDQGAAAERLNTAGFAAVRPLGPNDTADGRAKNRRVEFVFEPHVGAANGTTKKRPGFRMKELEAKIRAKRAQLIERFASEPPGAGSAAPGGSAGPAGSAAPK